MRDFPQKNKITKKKGLGKLFWILTGVLITLVILAGGFFGYTIYLQKRSVQRHVNLVEIPKDVDYQNLTTTSEKEIIKAVVADYPAKKLKVEGKEQIDPMVQSIILTKDGKKIPSGQNPGSTEVDSFTAEEEAPVLGAGEESQVSGASKGPKFSFGVLNPNPTDTEIKKLKRIKNLVKKYYPIVAKIFGKPFNSNNRKIRFTYDTIGNPFYYMPQLDMVVVADTSPWSVVHGLTLAFQGDYVGVMPETWYYGMSHAMATIALRKYPADLKIGSGSYMYPITSAIKADYEKYNVNNYPISSTNIYYIYGDIFDYYGPRVALTEMAFLKPLYYNGKFFQKLNKKIYLTDLNDQIWDKESELFNRFASAFPTIEKKSPANWYAEQHVLHQTQNDGISIWVRQFIGQTFVYYSGDMVQIYSFKTVPANGAGNYKFTPRANHPHRIKVESDFGELIKEQDLATDYRGFAMGNISQGLDEPISGRYVVNVKTANETDQAIQLPFYRMVGDNNPLDRRTLYGGVVNFGKGSIAVYRGSKKIQNVAINNGFFKFDKACTGVIKVKVKDRNGTLVLQKEIAKDRGEYLTVLFSPVVSYPVPAIGDEGSRSSRTSEWENIDTSDWLTYDEQGFSVKYPKDWEYKVEQSEPGKPQWFVSFGPKNEGSAIWIGATALPLDQFKEEITEEWIPGFTVDKEEVATIDSRSGTKLTLVPKAASYYYCMYYIPFFNLSYLFEGPAMVSKDQFQTYGEPYIFEKMLETFKFPAASGNQ